MIAIDLGSNTIRFIEYDGIRWGKSYEKIVRAAESIQSSNRIGDNAFVRILNAIAEAKEKLDFAEHEIRAVATAAFRMAKNSEDVIHKIYTHTGIMFTVIDGEQEAQLTLLAVKNRLSNLPVNPRNFVLVDIGGGSTELIHCHDKIIKSVSLPIGIVTMSEQAEDARGLRILLDDFENKVDLFCRSLEEQGNPITLVLTSGTPTTIAAYRMGMDYTTYDPEKINGSILTLEACKLTYVELMNMDEAMRAQYVGVGREQLIATGILMVVALFNSSGVKEAIVVDDGLREGVALAYFKSKSFA